MNIQKVINDSLESTLDELADINRDRMLDGVKASGERMPSYSYNSVILYGKPPGPIRLLDTGDFQQNIKVSRSGDVLVTESSDSKNDMLVFTYGSDIFGTFGRYKRKYLDIDLRPVFHAKIASATGLKFT